MSSSGESTSGGRCKGHRYGAVPAESRPTPSIHRTVKNSNRTAALAKAVSLPSLPEPPPLTHLPRKPLHFLHLLREPFPIRNFEPPPRLLPYLAQI